MLSLQKSQISRRLHAITISFKVIWNQFAEKEKQTPIKTAKIISFCNATNALDNFCRVPKLPIPIYINSQEVRIELDTATGGNFLSQEVWKKLGKPDLQKSSLQFQSASIYFPFYERLSHKLLWLLKETDYQFFITSQGFLI